LKLFQAPVFLQAAGPPDSPRPDQSKNGRLTDLVFRLSEPYPEAVGIYIEHGAGYPSN
jgi:hypothetical protein